MPNHDQHRGPDVDAATPNVSDLKYLWDEYKYRHDLCWRAIYKIVTSVVLLSVIPYIRDELTKVLDGWMVIPPVLGVMLAAFGICMLRNELAIFAKSKLAHHTLQDAFLRQKITNEDYSKFVTHNLTDKTASRTKFDQYVTFFMVLLLLLSVGNVLFLWLSWIPHIIDP